MGSPEKPRGNVTRNFARLVLPAALAATALTASGCSGYTKIRFPDCKTDPQTKHENEDLGNGWFNSSAIEVGEVIFRVRYGREEQVNLSGNTKALTIVEENNRYVLDEEKTGRIDNISIAPPQGGTRNVTIESVCKT